MWVRQSKVNWKRIMKNGSATITQKVQGFPSQSVVHKWSEGQAESRTLAQGELKLSNYPILCKSSNMEVKTRSGGFFMTYFNLFFVAYCRHIMSKIRPINCPWLSRLSIHPSSSYLTFVSFRSFWIILIPTFCTGMPSCRSSTSRRKASTRPICFTVGVPGFVPVVPRLSWHNSPKAWPYSCSIIQSCCNPRQWRGTNVLEVVGFVHLCSSDTARLTGSLFFLHAAIAELFFWSRSDTLRGFGCYVHKTTSSHSV